MHRARSLRALLVIYISSFRILLTPVIHVISVMKYEKRVNSVPLRSPQIDPAPHIRCVPKLKFSTNASRVRDPEGTDRERTGERVERERWNISEPWNTTKSIWFRDHLSDIYNFNIALRFARLFKIPSGADLEISGFLACCIVSQNSHTLTMVQLTEIAIG